MVTYPKVKPGRIELLYVLGARDTKNRRISLSEMTVAYNFLPLFNFVNSGGGLNEEASPTMVAKKGFKYISCYSNSNNTH